MIFYQLLNLVMQCMLEFLMVNYNVKVLNHGYTNLFYMKNHLGQTCPVTDMYYITRIILKIVK